VRLSQKEFNEYWQGNKLAISFIGMSNTGKSYWSQKFAELNFKRINCDELIEAKLAPELKEQGYSGIEDVSKWMGQPYEKRFTANQQKYLDFEKDIIKQITAELKANQYGNVVIDTTGSFVHLEKSICSELKKHSVVVCIEATKDIRNKMFKLYIEKPKPVVFGNVFVLRKGETDEQTLKRCYQTLLDNRSRLYKQYADVVVPRDTITDNMSIKNFVSLLNNALA